MKLRARHVIMGIGAFVAINWVLSGTRPSFSDTSRFWLSLAGAVLVTRIAAVAKIGKARVSRTETPQVRPSLEVLERHILTRPALKWITDDEVKRAAARVASHRQSGTPTPLEKLLNIAAGWHGAAATLRVQGRDIGGLVYAGPPPLDASGKINAPRAWIDTTALVAATARDPEGRQLPYWPSYRDIPPESRASYLDWLASGRPNASVGAGYLFLYFYGLERRFLQDDCSEDEKRRILEEVTQLKQLWGDQSSPRRYLNLFLDFARLKLDGIPQNLPASEAGWEFPLRLNAALGAAMLRQSRIGGDWLYAWYIAHPETRLLTAAKRCPQEFEALFKALFDQAHPEGLKLRLPSKRLVGHYQAASGEFEDHLVLSFEGKAVRDVSGLRAPQELAKRLAQQASAKLDSYSRYLGRTPDGAGSLKAAAHLPAEIAGLFAAGAMQDLAMRAKNIIDRGGFVPSQELLRLLDVKALKSPGLTELAQMSKLLERAGFALAPDPLCSLHVPRPDQPVLIYVPEAPLPTARSAAYQATMLKLGLSASVVHADSELVEAEAKLLSELTLDLPDLLPGERHRLAANLHWLRHVSPDLSALRQRLSEAAPAMVSELRLAMIAAAAADQVIRPAEVALLKKIYALLGIDPALVYSDLAQAPITAALTNAAAGAVLEAQMPLTQPLRPPETAVRDAMDGPVLVLRDEPPPAGEPLEAGINNIVPLQTEMADNLLLENAQALAGPVAAEVPSTPVAAAAPAVTEVQMSEAQPARPPEPGEPTTLDGPVQVRSEAPPPAGELLGAATGAPAPVRSEPAGGLSLDKARLAALRRETEGASSLLSRIFAATDTEPPEPEPGPALQEEVPAPLSGLRWREARLLQELLKRPNWHEDEIRELASAETLLMDGAIEAINEWSYGRFDLPVLEFYEDYTVDPTISAKILKQLAET